MLTKNAIGNMINRYTAVLKKCHLLNTLGTLAFVTAVGVAGVGEGEAFAYTPTLNDSMLSTGTSESNYTSYTTYSDSNSDGILDEETKYIVLTHNSTQYATVVDIIPSYSKDGRYTISDTTGTVSFTVDGTNFSIVDSTQANTTDDYLDKTLSDYIFDSDIHADTNFIGNDTNGGVLKINSGVTVATLNGDFIGNTDNNTGKTKHGSAINNSGTITIISGDFIGNVITDTTSGGTIFNDYSIGTIQGNFIANNGGKNGGAIWNADSKTITTIEGDFIGNISTGTAGAIQNGIRAIIGTITGDFVKNTSVSAGGAIANFNGSTITSITGNFINNNSGTTGGAVMNVGTIGTGTGGIIADFYGNKAGTQGGAVWNNTTITFLDGDFVGNTANGEGGAIYNTFKTVSGANTPGTIITITGDFTSNSASSGGAIYNNSGTITTVDGDFANNEASSTSGNAYGGAIYNTGTITTISGDFKNNTASTNGGAIYTTGDIGFLANNEKHEFTNNVAGTSYNAIYVGASGVDLTFTMQGTDGSFTMNDGITGSATTTSYDVAIAGADNTQNVFELNNAISDAGEVTISKAKLVLGTFDHTGAKDAAGTVLDDLTTQGDLYFRDTLMGDNAVLEIAVGTMTDNNETINRVVTAGTGEVLDVGDDDEFIITSGTFDIVGGTLKVKSGAQQFSTADGSVLKANIANFGYSGGGESKVLTLTGSNDLVNTKLTNNGSLVLVYDGLSINKTAYEYLKQYLDGNTTNGEMDWSEIVGTPTSNVSVDFGTPTLSGYYSLTTHVDEDTSDTGINLDEFVMAGDLATNEELTAVGIVKNTIEADKESLNSPTYNTNDTDISSTIASGATLTLTGASFMVGSTDTNADHVLLDEGTLTNSGTLNLGVTNAADTSNFNGALTGTGTASTTKVLSDTNFAKKTDMKLGATLDIQDDTSMAGLNVDGDSFLELTKGTLTLKTADVSGTTLDATTTASVTPSSDINAYATELIADAFVSDSDIDGKLSMVSGTTFKTESGVTNIVDADMWDDNGDSTISGSITVTGTLVAGFDDFVSGAEDSSTSDTPLSMTTLKDQVSITGNDATLILDGETRYVNKEDFAELLKSDAWIGDTGFINKSTGTTAELVIDYGVGQDTDTDTATLDNTYTYDTTNGTITVTNLRLTDSYSLTHFLANKVSGVYTLTEAVISGTLAKDVTLVATNLLHGSDTTSSIISENAALTLTGGTGGVLLDKGTLTNNGTLTLGENGNSADLSFNGKLTTNSTGTTTVNGPISITGAVASDGKTTFSGEAELKDTLNVTGDTTTFNGGGSVAGKSTVNNADLVISGNTSMAGVDVESGTFDINSGTVTLTGDSDIDGSLNIDSSALLDISGGTVDILGATLTGVDGTIDISNGKVIANYGDVIGNSTLLSGNITLSGSSAADATLELVGAKSLTSTQYNTELGSLVTEFGTSDFTRGDTHLKDLTSTKGTINITGFTLTDNYLTDFIADSKGTDGVYTYDGDITYDDATTGAQNTLLAGTKLIADSLKGADNGTFIIESTIIDPAALTLTGGTGGVLLDKGTLTVQDQGTLTLGDGTVDGLTFNGTLTAETGSTTTIKNNVTFNNANGDNVLSDIDGALTIDENKTLTVAGDVVDIFDATLSALNVKGTIDITGGKVIAAYDTIVDGGALNKKVTVQTNGTLVVDASTDKGTDSKEDTELNSTDYTAKLDAVASAYTDISRDAHLTDFDDDGNNGVNDFTSDTGTGTGTIQVTGITLGENYLSTFLTESKTGDVYSVVGVNSGDIDYDSTKAANTLLANTKLIANSLNSDVGGDAKDDASFIIKNTAVLTLNGDTSDVLVNADTVTNSGTLNLGVTNAADASNFNGALTGTGTGSTTKVLSDTNFAKKTDIKEGADLVISANTSMAGLNVDGDSFLNVDKGTLTLVDDTAVATTTMTDINAYAAELIASGFVSDSDIDGKLTMASGTTFKTESGITNIVGAKLAVADDENTKLTVTGGTLVAAFSDFVEASNDAGVTYTPTGVTAAKSLTMTDLKDQLSITADDATVILDGQADYINKESFATLLNGDAWIGDSGFVKKSTGSNGSFALDYGAENGQAGADFTDEGNATLDNTYTFDTAKGTITITNLNLTDYYSLSQFLRHGTLDSTTGKTSYTFAEPVISGNLGANINFTAPTLLQGDGQTSTIASSSTLTLTGAGYKENGDTVNAGVLVTGGTLTNNGTLNLGASGNTADLTFTGKLTTNSTGTTTVNGPISITGAVASDGKTTFSGEAELKDTLTVGTTGEVEFTATDKTATIADAVTSAGTLTFKGTAELKDTLNVTGDTTSFEGMTTIGMANTATGAVTVEDGGEVVFGNDVNDTTTIYGAVESDGKTTFKGTAELKDTLNVTGDTTSFEGMTTIDGVTTVSDGTLKIGSATTTPTVNPTVTMSGIDVTEKGKLNVESGKVILTANADIDGTLLMTDGTGMEAQGVDLAIKKGPDTNAYFFATDNVNDEKSTITIESFSNDTDGNALVNFSAYADNGSSLIFGAVPTTGDSKVQYDYIMDTVTDAADKELLYVGLDRPLKMANGTNLVLGSNPTTTPTGSYFGANSLVIADMAGIDKTEAVISGSGTLEVHKDSSLGLVNANEGEYIIVDGFSSSTVYDTNNAGTDVPWDEDSVTIGNCLLVVDSVTGIGTTANPYKVKVRQDVPEELYEADGGDLLKDVVDSGNFSADSTDPLGKLLYDAAEKGEDSLAKAQAGAATGGASSGANASGMAAARAATATFDIRNTIVNVGSLTDAGGTLLVKDASGKVTAEYTNVIEVADGVSISDAPAALGGTGSDLGNSIGLWAMPFYTHESISGARMGSHTNNTKTDLYGVTLGADKTFTPAGIDVLRLGLAFNVGTGETDGSGYVGTSKNDFEFFGLAAYGSMRKGSATVSGSISYTNSDGEFSTETCTGETNTDVWYAALNAENAFNIGTIDGSAFFTDFNIIPYIGIGYMTSKTDDYKTSLARTVEIDRQNVITLPLGLKFNKEFHLDSGWILKPQFSMGAIFADGDLDQRSVTGGASINTQVADDITYDLDLSIDIRKGHFGFFFDYDVQKSDIRTAHGVSVKAEYRF